MSLFYFQDRHNLFANDWHYLEIGVSVFLTSASWQVHNVMIVILKIQSEYSMHKWSPTSPSSILLKHCGFLHGEASVFGTVTQGKCIMLWLVKWDRQREYLGANFPPVAPQAPLQTCCGEVCVLCSLVKTIAQFYHSEDSKWISRHKRPLLHHQEFTSNTQLLLNTCRGPSVPKYLFKPNKSILL